jgi:hypothetical protein
MIIGAAPVAAQDRSIQADSPRWPKFVGLQSIRRGDG